MHEFGIAMSILAAVEKEMVKHAGSRALKIGVKIGPMAGVDREALSFCFQAAVEQESMPGLELEIQDGAADELDLTYLELEES